MTTHSVERTSPKGEPFVGKCVLCGQTGLSLEGALAECPNPRNVPDEDAIIEMIDPNTIPDRVCIDEESPYFWPKYKQIEVEFNGKTRPRDVVEFCVSEGWIRAFVRIDGRLAVERGRVRTVKLRGEVKVSLK